MFVFSQFQGQRFRLNIFVLRFVFDPCQKRVTFVMMNFKEALIENQVRRKGNPREAVFRMSVRSEAA